MRITLLLIFVLAASNFSLAGTQLTNQNFDWYSENREYIRDLIKSGNVRELVPVINTIGTIWKYRDGAIGSEVSEGVAEAMIYQPKLIFTWFNKHPEQLIQWNKRMQPDLFTDYAGSQAIVKRMNSIKDLLNSELFKFISTEKDRKLVAAAITVLDSLRTISVREIN